MSLTPVTDSSPSVKLEDFIQDPSSSGEQKVECLKLLRVVIKNLTVTTLNEKHCKLRLDNPKVQQRLIPFPHALEYLRGIGFEEEDGELRILQENVDVSAMESCLQQVSNAFNNLLGEEKSACSNEQPKLPPQKLSEKQKARLLLEKKEKEEKLRERQARKRNLALLKQDKYVRKNDANWKSGVSAACTKSGEGISTFRDKYGEN